MPNKPITRHQNEGSKKAEAKVTKALEIKNHAHCQGATKVPGKRINLTSGLNTKEPPTKHLACSVALYNSSPIMPRVPAHFPLCRNMYWSKPRRQQTIAKTTCIRLKNTKSFLVRSR